MASVRRMVEGKLEVVDGRTVGWADAGTSGTPVLWCHGGPGSRLEGIALGPVAEEAGLRIVGIDRPGYGASTPQPGRTIAGWVADALAVVDHLGIDRFAVVGVSTGGAYALAVAAAAPDRVLGAVLCCALTDMAWDEGRAMVPGGGTEEIWAAPDRETALAIAVATFGDDGTKIATAAAGAELPAADVALFMDPEWLGALGPNLQASFTQGVVGYTDDRLADGLGWGSFDVAAVRCPVRVIHGGSDTIVPVAHAHHTASIVPGATLHVFDDLGHFSIVGEVVPQLSRPDPGHGHGHGPGPGPGQIAFKSPT